MIGWFRVGYWEPDNIEEGLFSLKMRFAFVRKGISLSIHNIKNTELLFEKSLELSFNINRSKIFFKESMLSPPFFTILSPDYKLHYTYGID